MRLKLVVLGCDLEHKVTPGMLKWLGRAICCSIPARRFCIMPHYAAVRNFLSHHHGYYCEECLAAGLSVSEEQIRRTVGRRVFADVAIAYRICQSCLEEKGVFALRVCGDLN